jgi:hypothetical protein
MDTYTNSLRYAAFNGFDIEMPLEAAEDCSRSGDCEADVRHWMNKIRRPLSCTKEKLKQELAEYGSWEEKELKEDGKNWMRIVWIAAGNIVEEERNSSIHH